jgi:uncharacterized membrane protein YkoI
VTIDHSSPGRPAVGVCALVLVGALGVAGVGLAGASGVSAPDAPDAPDALAQQGTQTGNVTVAVTEAMTAAQNATNGTAIGAELTREGDVADLERPTRVYEVDVLLSNGTRRVAQVNATDGSVRQVTTPDDGLLDDLFSGDAPGERADPSAIRSAVEAVELVRAETGENGTVTSVELSEADGRLRYTVETTSTEGVRSTAVVAADPNAGGILTTDDGE